MTLTCGGDVDDGETNTAGGCFIIVIIEVDVLGITGDEPSTPPFRAVTSSPSL
jgi:hypothetical protein